MNQQLPRKRLQHNLVNDRSGSGHRSKGHGPSDDQNEGLLSIAIEGFLKEDPHFETPQSVFGLFSFRWA